MYIKVPASFTSPTIALKNFPRSCRRSQEMNRRANDSVASALWWKKVSPKRRRKLSVMFKQT
eukprot:765585-Hanusia_phi.AAC.3